jgi:hypothetical protein
MKTIVKNLLFARRPRRFKSLLSKASRLGRALFAMRDRQFGALRVEGASRAHNMTRWRLVAVRPPEATR